MEKITTPAMMEVRKSSEEMTVAADVNLVLKFVIAAEHDKPTPGDGEREKHLFRRLPPHLWIRYSFGSGPGLGNEEFLDTIQRALQGTPEHEQDHEQQVGKGGGEVDDVTTGLDSLDETG